MTNQETNNQLSQDSIREIDRLSKQFKIVMILLTLIPSIILTFFLIGSKVRENMAVGHDRQTLEINSILGNRLTSCRLEVAEGVDKRVKLQRELSICLKEPLKSDEPKDPSPQGKGTGQGGW